MKLFFISKLLLRNRDTFILQNILYIIIGIKIPYKQKLIFNYAND